MNDHKNCLICRKHDGLEIVPGGAIYENELFYSGHSWSAEDKTTPYLGSFIVEPKRHIPTWAELNDLEAKDIGRIIRDVSKGLKKGFGAEHVYVFVIGHHIPHLHVWIVPRYPGTPREYWGMELFAWPERPLGDAAAVEKVCGEMRSLFA